MDILNTGTIKQESNYSVFIIKRKLFHFWNAKYTTLVSDKKEPKLPNGYKNFKQIGIIN